MSVGLTLNKAGLDSVLGETCRSLNAEFAQVAKVQAWLVAQPDLDLQSIYGYSASDVANMKAAFADLDQLRQVYEGTASLAVAKNFRTFASRLWGLGF